MEIEDYGLTVRILDSYTSDEIRGPTSLNLPLKYPGYPCSFGIESDEKLALMVTVADIRHSENAFVIKISVWEKDAEYIDSETFRDIIVDPNDMREAIFKLAEPLLSKNYDVLAQSFCTHFNSLAQWLNYSTFISPKELESSIKSNT